MANTSWLIVIFGECQLIAKLITRGSPVTPLIHKDFRVCHPLLARRNYAALTLNHQKWRRAHLLSQSIGGSLRLPLLQNGACPFPCTPLLRVLMLVTQTDREVLRMFPGFRIMAVSMSGLEIAIARIPSMPTDMVNLQLVTRLEEQPTIGTAPALPFEQGGEAGTDRRVASPSRAPIDPISIVRTPIACDLGVPQTGDLTMGGEIHLAFGGGRCGKHPAGVPSRPVPVIHLSGRGVGVSSACPVAELHPREMIHPTEGGLAHPGPIIMSPTADFGVELTDQGRLGPGPTAAHDPPELR
jgi:hypothetical protein